MLFFSTFDFTLVSDLDFYILWMWIDIAIIKDQYEYCDWLLFVIRFCEDTKILRKEGNVGLASDVDKRRYTWKVSRLFATQKRRFI